MHTYAHGNPRQICMYVHTSYVSSERFRATRCYHHAKAPNDFAFSIRGNHHAKMPESSNSPVIIVENANPIGCRTFLKCHPIANINRHGQSLVYPLTSGISTWEYWILDACVCAFLEMTFCRSAVICVVTWKKYKIPLRVCSWAKILSHSSTITAHRIER